MLRVVKSAKRLRFSRLPALAFLGLALFTVLSLLGMVVGTFSIFTHFQLYLALAWATGLILFGLFPSIRRCFWVPKRVVQVGLFLLLTHAAVVGSLWIGPPQPDLAAPNQLDIVWFNSHHQLAGVADLEHLLATDLPDVIALCEVGLGVDIQLPGFDYVWRGNREAAMLIASRYPLENMRILSSVKGARDQLLVDVVVGRRRFKLMAVHLRKPYDPEHNDEMAAIAQTIAPLHDAIVLGDFNTTPWAAQFRNLSRDAQLHHARAGFGLLNSFGLSRWRLVPIPIDHMLYKGAIGIESFEVLPWISSDHRPIRASFLIGTPRGRKARSNN
jgi:endonuclease/exonuclease/phosphatase (EEP) superfamily protein YafD